MVSLLHRKRAVDLLRKIFGEICYGFDRNFWLKLTETNVHCLRLDHLKRISRHPTKVTKSRYSHNLNILKKKKKKKVGTMDVNKPKEHGRSLIHVRSFNFKRTGKRKQSL